MWPLSVHQYPLVLRSVSSQWTGPVSVYVLTFNLMLCCSYLEIQKTFLLKGQHFSLVVSLENCIEALTITQKSLKVQGLASFHPCLKETKTKIHLLKQVLSLASLIICSTGCPPPQHSCCISLHWGHGHERTHVSSYFCYFSKACRHLHLIRCTFTWKSSYILSGLVLLHIFCGKRIISWVPVSAAWFS